MKNLLYKELKLCVPLQTWIFIFLSITIMIPSWPSLISFFYPLAGITVVFTLSNANRDLLYTSILPLRKKDVVKGKVLLISFLEIISMLVSLPFGFLKLFLQKGLPEEQIYPELGFNLALYGFVFLVFGVFNLICFPWYYKKPEAKVTLPFLISDLVTILLISFIMAVFILFPEFASYVNSYELPNLLTQIAILLGGLLSFLGFTFLANHLAQRNFQKVDI